MKILSQNFDENTGITTICLTHKGKTATGKAKLHPDDVKIKNYFTGCRLAEQRAYLKILEYELKANKHKLKTTLAIKHDLEEAYKNESMPSLVEHRINLFIRNYKNEIDSILQQIQDIEKYMLESIEKRDEIVKRNKNKNE